MRIAILNGVLGIVCLSIACSRAAPAMQEPDAQPTLDRAWVGDDPDFVTNDISPDGRYMSDINWNTGDFQLVDLRSGDVRDVTGRGYGDGRYAWTSAFSRDGRRVAVSWYFYEESSHEIRVMDLDGGRSRVIVPAREEWSGTDPLDWTPSGDEIAVALQGAEDRVWRIAMVPVNGGELRILKTLDWPAPGGEQTYPAAEISPDGDLIAYDYPPEVEEVSRDIYALALDGSGETALVQHPAWDRLIGWLPDGDGLLFYSDRGGRAGIWHQPVEDGRGAGEPTLIRSGAEGLLPIGISTGGKVFFGRQIEGVRVRTAKIDLEAGQVLSGPEPVDEDPALSSLGSDWALDRRALAYVRHHPPPPDPVETLVVRSPDGELMSEVELPPALHTSYATLRWVEPGSMILFGMERGRPGIVRLDPRTGVYSRLPDPEQGWGRLKKFAVGPHGRLLYLTRPDAGGATDILERTAATGEQRSIGKARVPDFLSVSPDGRELAMVAMDPVSRQRALRAMATDGSGEIRTIHTPPAGVLSGPVAWTPDGTHLLFGFAPPGGSQSLWSISADGDGEAAEIGGGPAWQGLGDDLQIHADGRSIAFVAGQNRGEVLVLERR